MFGLPHTQRVVCYCWSHNMRFQEMATAIKESIMEVEEGNWHVFVGRKFSVFTTHEDGKFIYFYVGQTGFCVFCTWMSWGLHPLVPSGARAVLCAPPTPRCRGAMSEQRVQCTE